MAPVRRSRISRRDFIKRGALTGAGLVAAGSAANVLWASSASANPTVGAWGPTFNSEVIGTHTTVLRTGKVLMFSYVESSWPGPPNGSGSDARLWDPVTGGLTTVTMARPRELFCSGHSLLPDGRVFVTGGEPYGNTNLELGAKETDLFDPSTNQWTAGPTMGYLRYYPSNVLMPNGNTLIFSGTPDASKAGADIKVVESYTLGASSITQLPSSANLSAPQTYPHLFVMPSGKVFYANFDNGYPGPPVAEASRLFDPATNTWSFVANSAVTHVYEEGSPTVLLPGLQKVLNVGGSGPGGALSAAQIIDLSAPTPMWRLTTPLKNSRRHGMAVLLPDGKVLVVGGAKSRYTNPVNTPEMFDPVAETWTSMATHVAPRAYHASAALLPDGRVLTTGQDTGSYAYTGQVFSPPYLFKGARPAIGSVPSSVGYNQAFGITTGDASSIGRAVLMWPCSMTHSLDSGQRSVNVPFTVGSGVLNATSPPNANQAPPGWYMLFIVNTNGVPSVASWVHVG